MNKISLLVLFLFLCSCMNEDKPVKAPATSRPLSWNNEAWDKLLIDNVKNNFLVLDTASDVVLFCPKYNTLDEETRTKVLAEIFVWMSFYESSWKADTYYVEKTMGIDPITKQQATSEGLFQLSYQDSQWIKCGIDWKTKNIREPSVNIKCAVEIMSGQIKRKKKFILNRGEGAYWAVLIGNGRYTKVKEIREKVGFTNGCK